MGVVNWSNPISVERKVNAIQAFLEAFYGESSMEVVIYLICYIQKELRDVDHTD